MRRRIAVRLRKEWRDVTKWLLTGYRVHSLDYSFFIIRLLLPVFAFVFAVAAKTSTISCL